MNPWKKRENSEQLTKYELPTLDELISKLYLGSDFFGECWIWQGPTRVGYAYVYHRANISYLTAAHLLVKIRGDVLKECVRHTCDNKMCVNPNHIITGTFKQNMDDCKRNGNLPVNTSNGMAKLNDEIVMWIRSRDMSHRSDARRIGISWGHYQRVFHGTRWLHPKIK